MRPVAVHPCTPSTPPSTCTECRRLQGRRRHRQQPRWHAAAVRGAGRAAEGSWGVAGGWLWQGAAPGRRPVWQAALLASNALTCRIGQVVAAITRMKESYAAQLAEQPAAGSASRSGPLLPAAGGCWDRASTSTQLPVSARPPALTCNAEVEYAFADAYIHIAGDIDSEEWPASRRGSNAVEQARRRGGSSGTGGSGSGSGSGTRVLGRQFAAPVPAKRSPPLVRRTAASPPSRPHAPTPARLSPTRLHPPQPPPPPFLTPRFVPNDPLYTEQWALVSVGGCSCCPQGDC